MNLIKKFFKFLLYPFFGKKTGQKFFKFLFFLSLKGMNFGGGVNPKDSGEEFVANYALKKLKKTNLVVFDVGANQGTYTQLWLKLLGRQVSIYCFEPSKFLVESLQKKFPEKTVFIQNLALGESSGRGILFSNFAGSGLGSLIKRDLSFANLEMIQQEEIGMVSLDEFCANHKIQFIDFLKLDVEGFEFNVLKGAKNFLENKKIPFIQFEFGGADIDAKVFFKDFYSLLSPNYNLFRILKNGLELINKYSELDEIFITTNYLAELKNENHAEDIS